ncbi:MULTISPECIES: ATP-binding protein [Methylobacter]
MNELAFSGSAEITDEGIKKHFHSYDPIKALFELIWNGLDANAHKVDVIIRRNDIGGLESITILDDGDGIDIKNIKNNFEKFNESQKKYDDNKHGSHGKGRLAFHRLCGKATWYTRRESYDAEITIESSAIKNFKGQFIDRAKQNAYLSQVDNTGTCVELLNFSRSNLPENVAVIEAFGKEFGWFLALNKDRSIFVDGVKITVPQHELHTSNFNIDNISFSVKVIRWCDRPSSEKSFNYLINSDNKIAHKDLSKFNNKVKFYSSAYVSSEWVDKFDPDGTSILPEFTIYSTEYKRVINEVVFYQKAIYQEFLRRYVDEEMDRFDKNGYFPDYNGIDKNYAIWRKQNTKYVVKEIYLADPSIFNNINAKQAKILIRLLDKILVSNENDSLFDVLEGVVELDSENLDMLANQLHKTTLENVISTIESLQKRQHAVLKLREVMENRFAEVSETPDLQKIIENNTWLFGPQYTTLGAEEDTFQVIAKNLRDEVKDINLVNDDDLAEGAIVDGVNRQVDLFLARKVPTYDSEGKEFYKCVIIEIKRPAVSLNKKHLQQVDDYAEIITNHAAFGSDRMRFELILVGRKISRDDVQIKRRLNSLKDKGEYGLVTDDNNIKCYVKDWFTIFDEFDLSNRYLLTNLNTKLGTMSDTPTRDLIEELQFE